MTRAKSVAHLTTAQLGAKRLRTGRTRLQVMTDLCELLSNGMSLKDACTTVTDAPTHAKIYEWTADDPEGLGNMYAKARKDGYKLLADEIVTLSDATYVAAQVHATDSAGRLKFGPNKKPILTTVIMPLSPEGISHRRLQIDTRKWMLSKMLPKMYGDRTVIATESGDALNEALKSIAEKLPV